MQQPVRTATGTTAPPEIMSAEALNEAAADSGWPMLCDETCSFMHPLLHELLALWRHEAAAGIPQRQALTARKLQPFMRNLTLFERLSEGPQRRYRVRLMGSGIVQYYGELTGKYIDEVVPETFLPRWYAFLDTALHAARPVRLLLRADTFDKAHMVGECLCAPLAAEAGSVKFVLLGMILDGRRPWSVVQADARALLASAGSALIKP